MIKRQPKEDQNESTANQEHEHQAELIIEISSSEDEEYQPIIELSSDDEPEFVGREEVEFEKKLRKPNGKSLQTEA